LLYFEWFLGGPWALCTTYSESLNNTGAGGEGHGYEKTVRGRGVGGGHALVCSPDWFHPGLILFSACSRGAIWTMACFPGHVSKASRPPSKPISAWALATASPLREQAHAGRAGATGETVSLAPTKLRLSGAGVCDSTQKYNRAAHSTA